MALAEVGIKRVVQNVWYVDAFDRVRHVGRQFLRDVFRQCMFGNVIALCIYFDGDSDCFSHCCKSLSNCTKASGRSRFTKVSSPSECRKALRTFALRIKAILIRCASCAAIVLTKCATCKRVI